MNERSCYAKLRPLQHIVSIHAHTLQLLRASKWHRGERERWGNEIQLTLQIPVDEQQQKRDNHHHNNNHLHRPAPVLDCLRELLVPALDIPARGVRMRIHSFRRDETSIDWYVHGRQSMRSHDTTIGPHCMILCTHVYTYRDASSTSLYTFSI